MDSKWQVDDGWQVEKLRDQRVYWLKGDTDTPWFIHHTPVGKFVLRNFSGNALGPVAAEFGMPELLTEYDTLDAARAAYMLVI